MHTMLDFPSLGIALQDTEQPVVHPATLHPDLEVAGHVIVHRLPLAAAREGRRWRCRHSVEDGVDLCCDLGGYRFEELDRGHSTLGVVGLGALKKWMLHGFDSFFLEGTVISS